MSRISGVDIRDPIFSSRAYDNGSIAGERREWPYGKLLVMRESTAKNIVFFDGVCSFCNRSIDFLIRHDKHGQLHYAPLQGETYAQLQAQHPELESAKSMILAQQQAGESSLRISIRSSAVLRALALLPRPWCWARFLLVIPRFIRDTVYLAIARVRYKLFGRRETCRIPTAEERGLFLP